MALMLLLALPAFAHVPHDNVEGIAVAPGGTGAWYLLLNPTGDDIWMRSDDLGYTWSILGGPQLADAIGPPQALADGTVVVLGEGRYWYTSDGSTWAQDVLPAEVDRIVPGGELRFAGADGMWEGTPGGSFTPVVSEPIMLAADGVLLREDGEIVAESPEGWDSIGPADGDVTALATAGGTVFVGTEDGRILRWDKSVWTTCGDTGDRGAAANDVVRLAWDGTTLLVATGMRAPWASTDGCASFVDRSTGVETEYGPGSGGAEIDAEAFTGLEILGEDRWVVAGWAGLFQTSDGGATWVDSPLVPPEDTRGLALAGTFPVDPRVFVGAYSSSVLTTADGGLTWTSPNHGVSSTNVTKIYTHPAAPDRLWGILNHMPWLSDDGGVSWTPQDESLGTAEELTLFDDPLRWWVLTGGIWETLDGGATFTEAVEVETFLNPSAPVGVVELDDQLVVVASQPPLVMSRAGDGDWAEWYRTDAGNLTAPVTWPAEEPTRILVGDEAGVHGFALDGERIVDVDVDERIMRLARLGDDRLLAFTRSSLMLLSDDGGDTWASTGVRMPWPVASLVVRPDWAAHPEVLVGSYDGVWVLDFSGDTPEPRLWSGYERLDDIGNFLVCTDCPERVVDTDANLDSIQPLGTGHLSAWVRGVGVRVLGNSTGGGAELQIDSVTVGTIGAEAAEGDLGSVEGLDDSWHRFDLIGMPDADVSIDAVEAWRVAEPLDLSIPPVEDSGDSEDSGKPADEARCGCTAAPSMSPLWLIALAIRRRRQDLGDARALVREPPF